MTFLMKVSVVLLRTVAAVSRELCSLMADPKKYRDRAERLRKVAIGTFNRDIRGTMIEVAELYDRLADILERQRRHPTIP